MSSFNRSQVYPLSWDSPNRKKRYRVAITLPFLKSLATGQFPWTQEPCIQSPVSSSLAKRSGTLLETQSASWEPWTLSTSYQSSFPEIDSACWQESWKVRNIPEYLHLCWRASACPNGLVLVLLWIVAFIHRKKSGWIYTKALIIIIWMVRKHMISIFSFTVFSKCSLLLLYSGKKKSFVFC